MPLFPFQLMPQLAQDHSLLLCVLVDAIFVSNMFLDQGVAFFQGVALASAVELEVSYFLRFVLATMMKATSFNILIIIVCDNLAGHLVCHSVEKKNSICPHLKPTPLFFICLMLSPLS